LNGLQNVIQVASHLEVDLSFPFPVPLLS